MPRPMAPRNSPFGPGDLAGDHRGPDAGDAAVDRLDQHGRRLRIGLEGLEVGPVRDADRGRRPAGRAVDQPAVGIEDIDATDIGQRIHLGLEHQVDFLARHPAPVILCGRDTARAHEGDEVLLDDFEVFELLVEMAGQQQHGIFQFALAVAQRALAEIAGHESRADRNRGDKQDATQNQPADRAAAKAGCELEGTDAGRNHRRGRCLERTPEADFSQRPARHLGSAARWS